MLPVDIVDDIADDADVDSRVNTERDIRVDHDDFNPVGNSRIADVITFHRRGQPMPVIEPEDKPRKKALFTARVDPSVVEMLRAYCEFLNSE
jgi:hypothetical protein